MWVFSSIQIPSECHRGEKITTILAIRVLRFWFECSGALEATSRLGLNIQTNFPLELALAPSFAGPPHLASSRLGCLCRAWTRHGTWWVQAGVRGRIVIPSYVSTPDVLLTSIDFFTRGTFFLLAKKKKKATLQEWKALGGAFLMRPSLPFCGFSLM